jgi:hypothetical protein
LFITRSTNDHVKQNNAIFFAENPIGLANDYLLTVPAKELHGRWVQQGQCRLTPAAQVTSNDKRSPEIPRTVPLARIIRRVHGCDFDTESWNSSRQSLTQIPQLPVIQSGRAQQFARARRPSDADTHHASRGLKGFSRPNPSINPGCAPFCIDSASSRKYSSCSIASYNAIEPSAFSGLPPMK